jgi:hypothetical protein
VRVRTGQLAACETERGENGRNKNSKNFRLETFNARASEGIVIKFDIWGFYEKLRTNLNLNLNENVRRFYTKTWAEYACSDQSEAVFMSSTLSTQALQLSRQTKGML